MVGKDHVHLVPEAYRKLAGAVIKAAAAIEDDEASSSIVSNTGSMKRRRLESVVTLCQRAK